MNNYIKTNKLSYRDYLDNTTKTYTLPDNNIVRPLEIQIQSEEFTTHHALEENGLRFDKWASVDITSSALIGLNNGYNALSDLIEIRYVHQLPKQ